MGVVPFSTFRDDSIHAHERHMYTSLLTANYNGAAVLCGRSDESLAFTRKQTKFSAVRRSQPQDSICR